MRRVTWWKRRVVWMPLVLLAGLLVAAAVVVVPKLPAVRFLKALDAAEPTRAEIEGVGEFGTTMARGGVAVGERGRLCPILVVAAEDADAPAVVVVHGVTERGIQDPRVWRLALALREAGFAAIVPEIEVLKRMGRPRAEDELPGPGPDPYDDAVAVVRAQIARTDRRVVGLMGVSVGGGLALEAAAKERGAALRAILLVGAPDDVRALARDWFRVAPVPAGATGAAAARADAAEFARLAVLRAALPVLVSSVEERFALGAWLSPEKGYRVPPPSSPGPTSLEGRRFVAAAERGVDVGADDLAWLLTGADRALAAMSPAAWDADLSAIRASVFLVHGASDPLVPASEMSKLEARLARRTSVRAIESRMLEHVGTASPGLGETWRHVELIEAYFDAANAR